MSTFNQEDPSIGGLDQLRHQALVSNLWVILATIICSAALSLPFAESGFTELFSGFFIYFTTNCFALWTAYRGAHRLALFTYTSQVFLCTSVAMILLNDQPAHMVLAMANFVLLHAVVLGHRWALTVTAIMVLLLVFASWGGETYALHLRAWLGADEAHLQLTDQTALTSLLTTTLSTGYLITTTVSLQEQSRVALIEAHTQLASAKSDLEYRHDRVRLLSDAGAHAAGVTSHKELYESISRALKEGLPAYEFELLPLGAQDALKMSFGSGPQGRTLSVHSDLKEDDERFARTLVALFDGVHTRMEAERRLRAAERLEGVGRLAASVAHDFNNLLMPIHGSYDLLEHHEVIPSDMQKLVEPGLAATRQAKALVKKLLVHARSIDLHVEQVDFRSILESSEALLRTFVVDSINLRIEFPSQPVFVLADRIELEQVLLNLVLNAITAVDASGEVIVALHHDDSEMFLEVRDDGPGVPENLRTWILEPFNSTRIEGSGLGLATVDRIARSGGGRVTVANAPEGGASVTFSLPTVLPAETRALETTDVHASITPLQILLVEDDPHVRSILKEMLHTLGHTCVAVCDGGRAVDVLQARGELDLVITDYQMPILNGVELIEWMRSVKDSRPVILLSGYGAAVSERIRSRPTAVLGKPVRLKLLEQTLSEAFPNGV